MALFQTGIRVAPAIQGFELAHQRTLPCRDEATEQELNKTRGIFLPIAKLTESAASVQR